jgi:MMP 1-O-methyltransferase
MDKFLRVEALATKGFMPADEGDALYLAACAACRELPKLPIVEIGTYCGRSTVWLGAAARKHQTKVFAIDHHFGSEENQNGWEWFDQSLLDSSTNQLNTLPSLLATLRRTMLSDVVIPIVGESKVISSQWSAKLAFCFLDGGHGEEPTRSDYLSWVPKIAVNGLLAIHDVFSDPKDGGQAPYKYIYMAALDSGEFIEISATGSLRILQRIKIAG